MTDTDTTNPISLSNDDVAFQRLTSTNARLHRAIRALWSGSIEWMDAKRIRGSGDYRVGLYDFNAHKGPSLITIYEQGIPGSEPMIRVADARSWAEGILAKVEERVCEADKALQDLARDVLIYMGQRGL